ncbi:hypothetical protein [Rufibacter quisquiliarum]|uniref:Uncharacterized protein n=1 Tax=Rufibacter quisquiliarum TaxID=1549639 RepID=A0A839GHI4_9BACT|nr:hypothetical protein [Rufibacter quisquiliarum]MBA9078342.1 hypothetical protein [Rufibacter quisquiliarum]
MFKEIKKIWCDTMLNPGTGRYSIKRFTTASCMLLFWYLVFASTIELHIWPEQEFSIVRPEIELVLVCLAGALGSTYLTIMGHLNSRKTRDANGQPLEPAYPETNKEE